MNNAATTNVFYLKKTTSSECDNGKQFGISREVIREFFDVPDTGNTALDFIGATSHESFKAEIQTATDPRLANAGIREFFAKEGGVQTGDYILFTKQGYRKFSVRIIKQGTDDYTSYGKLFLKNDDKHAGLFTDKGEENLSTPDGYYINYDQIIYYGVPGSGKSHTIDEKIKGISDEQKIRVVFHPEYTNADFVGQILPSQTTEGINYCFKPGPFTRILKRAIKNPDKPYYLIIEEINRGNASAIFGDLFQLLDRNSNGWSTYNVENLDINAFIRSKNDKTISKEIESSVNIGKITVTENTGIRLPPNLAILATMNTSDQNVFTLDNAFQRRWDMKLVKNECTDKAQMDATITVNNQSITWEEFQTQINKVIGEKSNESGLSSMEDKRLGCWFVKSEQNKISSEIFANKVLKYLWDDAFKFYHNEIFKSGIKNFEELQKDFFEIGFDVFNDVCDLKDKVKQLNANTNPSQTL